MADIAISLARRARRTALIHAIRSRPELTMTQLHRLIANSQYADELRGITIRDLVSIPTSDPLLEVQAGDDLEQAILRVFAREPGQRLASGFFCRYMGLERWTAQKVLAEMAERGLLVRTGKTSGTRYSLPQVVDRLPGYPASEPGPRGGRGGRGGRSFAERAAAR